MLGPGKFNEEAFRSLDLILQVANEQGVRLIIPLVNNWIWQGGRGEYAGFRGKTKDDFWTDPQLIADFKETIRFVLTRTNTLTGVRYCDDKAILCWETGNELSSPAPLDARNRRLHQEPGHQSSGHGRLRPLPSCARIARHAGSGHRHDPSLSRSGRARSRLPNSSAKMRELAKGKKPYIVGEFGFVSTAQMEEAMKAIMDSRHAGGLLWSLRFRDRDGGFYWHSEPDWAAIFTRPSTGPVRPSARPMTKPISWRWSASMPSPSAAWRRRRFRSRRRRPCCRSPMPAAISWQGSVGAASYTVERAPKAGGPWTVVGKGIDESFVQYRPLFADESAPAGEWYYRVRANNAAGASEPSNVVGPVKVTHATLVDELADFSKVYARQGGIGNQASATAARPRKTRTAPPARPVTR